MLGCSTLWVNLEFHLAFLPSSFLLFKSVFWKIGLSTSDVLLNLQDLENILPDFILLL